MSTPDDAVEPRPDVPDLGYPLELAHLSWLIGSWTGVGLGSLALLGSITVVLAFQT